MSNRYAAYFVLEKDLKRTDPNFSRPELIQQFTDNKKSSLTELGHIEYTEFCRWIRSTFKASGSKQDWQKSPENKMRQKMYRIFVTEMGYTTEGMNAWCLKHGQYHKALQDHDKTELSHLLVQADKVLKSYSKSLNK